MDSANLRTLINQLKTATSPNSVTARAEGYILEALLDGINALDNSGVINAGSLKLSMSELPTVPVSYALNLSLKEADGSFTKISELALSDLRDRLGITSVINQLAENLPMSFEFGDLGQFMWYDKDGRKISSIEGPPRLNHLKEVPRPFQNGTINEVVPTVDRRVNLGSATSGMFRSVYSSYSFTETGYTDYLMPNPETEAETSAIGSLATPYSFGYFTKIFLNGQDITSLINNSGVPWQNEVFDAIDNLWVYDTVGGQRRFRISGSGDKRAIFGDIENLDIYSYTLDSEYARTYILSPLYNDGASQIGEADRPFGYGYFDELHINELYVGNSKITSFGGGSASGGNVTTLYNSAGIAVAKGEGTASMGMLNPPAKNFWLGSSGQEWKGIFDTLQVNTTLTVAGESVTSDIRYKSEIENVELSLLQIAAAPIFNYRWEKDGSESTGTSAQYWQSILPRLVKEIDLPKEISDKSGILTLDYSKADMIAIVSLARIVGKLCLKLGIDISDL